MKGEHHREPPLRRCQNHVCVLAAGGLMCRADEEFRGTVDGRRGGAGVIKPGIKPSKP